MSNLIKVNKVQLESLIEERKQLQAEKAELLSLLQEIEQESGAFIGQFTENGKLDLGKIKDIVTPMLFGGFIGGNIEEKISTDGIIAVQEKVSNTLAKHREQENARRNNDTRAIDGANTSTTTK